MTLSNDGGHIRNAQTDQAAAKQSGAEDALAFVLDTLHLSYTRQFAYAPPRRFRADFLLTGHQVLIEVVGGVYPFRRRRADGREVIQAGAHGTIKGINDDIARLNAATLAGYRMLRFTPGQIRQGTARETIERLGW